MMKTSRTSHSILSNALPVSTFRSKLSFYSIHKIREKIESPPQKASFFLFIYDSAPNICVGYFWWEFLTLLRDTIHVAFTIQTLQQSKTPKHFNRRICSNTSTGEHSSFENSSLLVFADVLIAIEKGQSRKIMEIWRIIIIITSSFCYLFVISEIRGTQV